jgi:hypothetical protein
VYHDVSEASAAAVTSVTYQYVETSVSVTSVAGQSEASATAVTSVTHPYVETSVSVTSVTRRV